MCGIEFSINLRLVPGPTTPMSQRRNPETHLARTGPGKELKLSYSGNLVENRNG